MNKTPKTEPFIKMPVALNKSMLAADLSKREWSIMMVVVAETIGHNKESAWLASRLISEVSGIDSSHVRKVVSGLCARNILLNFGAGGTRKLAINTKYSMWKTGQNSPLNGPKQPETKGPKQPAKRAKTARKTGQNSPNNKKKKGELPDFLDCNGNPIPSRSIMADFPYGSLPAKLVEFSLSKNGGDS